MAAVALVSTPLARALRRFAADDEREDGASEQTNVGVALGTRRAAADGAQLAVWGVLRSWSHWRAMSQLLPSGIEPVARVAVFSGPLPHPGDAGGDDQVAACAAKALDQDADVPNTAVLVLVRAAKAPTQQLRMYARVSEGVKRLTLDLVECFHAREFLRAVGFVLARSVIDVHAHGDEDALVRLEGWQHTLADASRVFFRGVGARASSALDVVGADVTSDKSGASESLTVGELLGIDASADAGKKSKKSKKSKKKAKSSKTREEDRPIHSSEGGDAPRALPTLEFGDVPTVELLTDLTPEHGASAPVLAIPASSGSDRGGSSCRLWHLRLDALVALPIDAPARALAAALRQGLSRQVDAMSALVRTASCSSATAVSFEHYPLVGASFPLSLAASEEELVTPLAPPGEILSAFLQPLDRPVLDVSRGCALSAQARVLSASDVLFNVHEGLSPSGVASDGDDERVFALVDGPYGYFHYLQQGVRDQGWGCAYRSLQTLASWLQLNHYTAAPPPTHAEIQRALVRIGDKPSTFAGSREWIGSLEVGYALDELLGVAFRSLSVPSGARLPELARELQRHFETHGTPVMMGGGQLAFTLLGVDYDARSGNCALLVLDPHYVGPEELDAIQTKPARLEGYTAVPCSWRRTTSFRTDAFYNLCLPQRPSYAAPCGT